MIDAIRKFLSSRKFWAAVAGSIPFLFMDPPDLERFAQVWMVYLGAQGIVDAAAARKEKQHG